MCGMTTDLIFANPYLVIFALYFFDLKKGETKSWMKLIETEKQATLYEASKFALDQELIWNFLECKWSYSDRLILAKFTFLTKNESKRTFCTSIFFLQ